MGASAEGNEGSEWALQTSYSCSLKPRKGQLSHRFAVFTVQQHDHHHFLHHTSQAGKVTPCIFYSTLQCEHLTPVDAGELKPRLSQDNELKAASVSSECLNRLLPSPARDANAYCSFFRLTVKKFAVVQVLMNILAARR